MPDTKFVGYSYSTCCPRLIDSITDRSGRTTNFVYDALKQLVEITNPEQGATKYAYDPNGNLTQLIDPNKNITIFDYDLENRLSEKTFADGNYISFAYDKNGLLTTRIDARGIQTEYFYDENYNLITVSYSDGTPELIFEYDDHNRLTFMQDATGEHYYTYNANSQIVTVDGPWSDDTITYAYDALGRRTGITPQVGQALTHIYDNLHRLTEIQAGAGTGISGMLTHTWYEGKYNLKDLPSDILDKLQPYLPELLNLDDPCQ
ncbi:MAG: hypothetical protein ABIF87_10605 [Pseudomonadota bacterium]